ncbi:MAG: PHP domain-containing protein [Clostridia bacterium]|nr:PHP domain-containing protein [Clostridia bacterium]MBQ6183018.1 PHP domain-containing protein [Clostridia bacterium]
MEKRLRNIDLHMHTTVSDGTDTPEMLIGAVKAAGIEVFSATDHDAVKTGLIIRSLLEPGDPVFITGAEFSCKDEEGKYHILGYGFDPSGAPMAGLVRKGHALRMKKVAARIGFIKSEFGFEFRKEDIDSLFALDNPGKPHIANLMVKYGYATDKDTAMREYLNRMRFRSEYVRPEEAISAVTAAGGIPVLAHPFYGSGDELILGDEMEDRLRRLMEMGLRGVEAFYSGFSAKLRENMLALARKYRLYVTAGSDYHGSNKLVTLGDTGLRDAGEMPEGLIRFLKDAVK